MQNMPKTAYLKPFLWFLALFLILSVSKADYRVDYRSGGTREASTGTNAQKAFKRGSETLENKYSEELENIGIRLRPGTEHREDSKPTPRTSARCRSLVYQALQKLPKEHREVIDELTLYYTKDGRRGLGGTGSIVLRCLNVTDTELVSVLLHEVGHLVDASFLKGTRSDGLTNFSGFHDFDIPVPADDPSSYFFDISWTSEKNMRPESAELDFVSLYSMTDPFEDFAETYAYYRLHGPDFRKLAETNEKLAKKYEFMKIQVFGGEEFNGYKSPKNLNLTRRNYDATVLPFPLKSFLG